MSQTEHTLARPKLSINTRITAWEAQDSTAGETINSNNTKRDAAPLVPLVKPNAFHLPLASNMPVIFSGWNGWYLNAAAESQFLEGFSTDQTDNRTKNPGKSHDH